MSYSSRIGSRPYDSSTNVDSSVIVQAPARRKTRGALANLSYAKKSGLNGKITKTATPKIQTVNSKKRTTSEMEIDSVVNSDDGMQTGKSRVKLVAKKKSTLPGVEESGRGCRKRKLSAVLDTDMYDIPRNHLPKIPPDTANPKVNADSVMHLDVDPVYDEKFGVETTVRYSTQLTISDECDETLRKCWSAYKREYALPKTTKGRQEVIAFRDCIKNSSPDGYDKWTDKYEVKKVSDVVGHGLFATADYKKDEVIGFYSGHIVPTDTVIDSSYAFEMFANPFEGLTIEGVDESNATRYINHAPRHYSNIDTVEFFDKGLPYVMFTASRAIKAGEEFLYDYGNGYWEKKGIEPIFLPKNT